MNELKDYGGIVFTQCTILYYKLFYYMEDIVILDVHNEIHLFCLQYVYVQRVNHALSDKF